METQRLRRERMEMKKGKSFELPNYFPSQRRMADEVRDPSNGTSPFLMMLIIPFIGQDLFSIHSLTALHSAFRKLA